MDRSSTPRSLTGTSTPPTAGGPAAADDRRTGPGRLRPALESFLRRVADRGAAVVVTGDAGSGRSTELAAVREAARARGAGVVEVSGVRAESDLPSAALERLLDRLRIARPDGTGPPVPSGGPAPPAVGDATEALLAAVREAAVARPVLLVVDDLHLVDRPSREVLRRLVHALEAGSLPRVGLLTATPADDAAFLGAPTVDLPPLTPDAARSVLARRFPGLAPRVVERVVQEAEGNPLALVELPTAFTEEQARGLEDLPPVLPSTHRLAAAFGDRPEVQDPATREVLLLVALQGAGSPVPVAAISRDHPPGALRQALRSGLLSLAPAGTVRFPHPIGRLTVLALSTAEERRRAHLWWAAQEPDPVRRTWHLAAARLGPDPDLSTSLERTARAHLDRNEAHAAVAALVRAAELAPDPAGTGRLLAEAAYVAICVAGDRERAAALVARATETAGRGAQPAYALLAAAHVALHADGDVGAAGRAIATALRRIPLEDRDDPGTLTRALASAVELDALAMRPGRAAASRPASGSAGEVRSLRLLATLSDPTGARPPDPREVDAAVAGLAGERDPTVVFRVAGALLSVDRLGDCMPALLRVAAATEVDDGAAGTHVTAVMLLAMGDYQAGRWAEAARRCDHGLALVGPRGDRLRTAQFRCVRMMLAASRGGTGEVRRIRQDVEPWAVRQGVQALVTWCHLAQGLEAVARGDFETAFPHATAVAASRPAGTPGRATWGSLDLVESAVRTGRPDVAARHVREVLDDDLSRLSPRVSIVLPACRAMTTAGDGAAAFFAEALAAPALPQWPFEHARVRLVHGEWLRRARARREARAELAVAMDLFTELDASAWLHRATAEYHATAHVTAHVTATQPGRGRASRPQLTPQERHVARLAASGLTNGDIAARLLLSPKTIATHLSSAFRKLGIRSRVELRDALGPDTEPPASSHDPAPERP